MLIRKTKCPQSAPHVALVLFHRSPPPPTIFSFCSFIGGSGKQYTGCTCTSPIRPSIFVPANCLMNLLTGFS
ncbi:hypothetical protein GQ55_6G086600 [Panicum hallii var. hallii]|uniref:Uncharacterized protein n=1 Tax=Panicum hallii var. hallii TaxID=1504633 RepID=A0A2T7D5F0_9POAL|nr:hypothetical protein GQ55_6G086600 [Panicum hallii var. hallii]